MLEKYEKSEKSLTHRAWAKSSIGFYPTSFQKDLKPSNFS
jgi:hypothetical protein